MKAVKRAVDGRKKPAFTRIELLAVIAIIGILGARVSHAQDANAPDAADLRATVKQLQQHIGDQDKRIAELEARPATQASTKGVSEEEVREIVGQMNADAAKNSGDFKVVWNNGVWFKSNDGQFTFHPGGRLFADWDWFSAPGMQEDRPQLGQGTTAGKNSPLVLRDGEEFRNLRLWGEGTMYQYVQYKIEVDFANDTVTLKDAYIRMTGIPWVGNFQVGNFKEPFSLEDLTSDAATTFMERSLLFTLVPDRNPGFMASNAFLNDGNAPRMTYALGLFRQEAIGNGTSTSDGTAVYSDGGYAVTGRLTGLPYYADNGNQLIHLGLAYSLRGTNDNANVQYRARPEDHLSQYYFLDTGTLANVDHVQLFGAEAASVLGPFSLQSEFARALLYFDSSKSNNTTSRGNVDYNTFYTQASYFITPGDKRNYSPTNGYFAPVVPKKNFRQDGGWGAVELTSRISYLDLDENRLGANTGGTGRGEITDWTTGVNWYLNPNVRVMANYIRSWLDRPDTDSVANIFMMRFQLDF